MSIETPDIILTPEQIAFFHTNGFIALEKLATPEEVERLRGIYDRLFETRAGREEGNQFDLGGADEEGEDATLPQILNPSKYAPEMREGKYRDVALSVVRQLLGPEAQAGGEHAILKPPFHGAPTPWHQDEAYWNPDLEYCSVSLWMPLQEATLENGCLQFVPGSHQWEVFPHHSIGHDLRVHGLEVEGADTSTAVACPLPPGGATIHLNRTLHYAGPNPTATPRRAYILGFGLPAKPRTTPRRFPWNEIKQTAREERRKAAEAGKG